MQFLFGREGNQAKSQGNTVSWAGPGPGLMESLLPWLLRKALCSAQRDTVTHGAPRVTGLQPSQKGSCSRPYVSSKRRVRRAEAGLEGEKPLHGGSGVPGTPGIVAGSLVEKQREN